MKNGWNDLNIPTDKQCIVRGSKHNFSPPAKFCFSICSSSKFLKFSKFSTTLISLWPKYSLCNFTRPSKFSIFLILLRCRYNARKFDKLFKFWSFSIQLLCKYSTVKCIYPLKLFWKLCSCNNKCQYNVTNTQKMILTIPVKYLSFKYKWVTFRLVPILFDDLFGSWEILSLPDFVILSTVVYS